MKYDCIYDVRRWMDAVVFARAGRGFAASDLWCIYYLESAAFLVGTNKLVYL
jgi:hypothetical protein